MNLFSFTQHKVNNKFPVAKPFSICIFSLMTSFITFQNAHAYELDINLAENINSLEQFNYRNIVNGKFINSLPKLLTIKPKITKSATDTNTFNYLTFYSKKNEKLKATFKNGAYLIKYTRRWK